jgi:hypothetical protein
MSIWIAQHFLNPAFFWSGLALVSVPVIIHLIHRLRYRRVRFAAMEFLLASEQKNRRRILFEQLLLLLLRILIVLMLLALIGRFLWDAATWSFLRSSKTHHIVLLDDSGSMQDQLGDNTAFEAAKNVIKRLASQGAERPGTQMLSIVRMTRPTEVIAGMSSRDISEELQVELAELLDDMTCTSLRVDPARALEGVRSQIEIEEADNVQLHVVSDFRKGDWFDNEAVANVVSALSEAGAATHFVRTVPDQHDNIAITGFGGEVDTGIVGVPLQTAAVNIPVQFTVKVKNLGLRDATNVDVAVFADGERLPMNVSFERIQAGEEVTQSFPVAFDRAGHHRLSTVLEGDNLGIDDARFVAVDIPVENPVLIIDGTPGGEQAQYIADALAAEGAGTGYAPEIASLDILRRATLDKYLMVYMINIAEIPPDGIDVLERYVRAGGGLAWFMGDAVDPAFYNEELYRDGTGLFPCQIDLAPRVLPRNDVTTPGPDIVPSDHPLFNVLTKREGDSNPFIDLVMINLYYPASQEWRDELLPALPHVEVIAELKNRQPLFLEHTFGEGRIVTSLTSAGPLKASDGETWTNWAANPSFAVLQLDLVSLLAQSDRNPPQQLVGEPLEAVLGQAQYLPEVEVVTPGDRVLRILATDQANEPSEGGDIDEGVIEESADDSAAGDTETDPAPSTDSTNYHAILRETEEPGVYVMRLNTQAGEQEERWVSFNVSPQESLMELAEDPDLVRELGDADVTVHPAGDLSWIQFDSQGQEPRWWILGLLAIILLSEQMLAYRLSYHP